MPAAVSVSGETLWRTERPSRVPASWLIRGLASLVIWGGLAATPVLAQFSSTIDGTVTDPSGAAIPDAEVVVESVETKVSRTTRTSSSGYYRVPSLPPGRFRIMVSAPNFEAHVIEDFVLEGTQVKTVNVELVIGQATETVDVVGGVPLVETGESTISRQINETEVKELPLVGRNFMTLVVLSGGVTGLPSGGGQAYAQASGDIFSAEYGVNLNANGQRAESNSFLVDGASVNASPRGGVTNYNPNADSVQELRVRVNDFSAEYGRNSSAQVQVITKSGTNNYRGTAGWFHTDNALAARNTFQSEVPVFRRNEANWSLGGPILRNRTFAFGSMDILRSGVAAGFTDSAASPEFISLLNDRVPNNLSTFILNEFPSGLRPTGAGLVAGEVNGDVNTAAECGARPGGAGSPVMTPLGQLPCNFPMTFTGTLESTNPRNGIQWNTRVDHNFNDGNDRIFGSAARTTLQLVSFGAPSVYPAFTTMSEQYTGAFNLNHTHIFSSSLITESSFSGTTAWGNDPLNRGEIPEIDVPGIATIGRGFSDATFSQTNIEWKSITTWNRSSHSFKFGGIAQRNGCCGSGQEFAPVFERPAFSFNNLFEFALDDPFEESNIGFDPNTGETRGFTFRPIFTNFGLFVQDDWKVRPNLTVNLGLRWEVFMNPSEVEDLFSGATFPVGTTFEERIANLRPERKQPLDETQLNNFAPRLGIAWDPTGSGRTSIRAGAGIFYDRPAGQFFNDASAGLPLFGTATVSRQTAPAVPVFGLSSTTESPFDFPAIPNLQTGLDERNGLIGAPAAINIWDPTLETQYSMNWFFGVQRQIAQDWVVELNYNGSAGRHLYQQFDVNRFAGDVLDGQLDRLNPSFAGIDYGQANGKSTYHGGNVTVTRRLSGGLHFQTAYTLGKAIDTASSFGGGLPMVDAGNLGLNRGLSDFDVRQKLAMSIIYEVPNLAQSGPWRAIFGDWQVGAVTILQSGAPFSVFCTDPFSSVVNGRGEVIGNSACDYNADGFNYDFPDAPAFGNTLPGAERDDFLSGVFTPADFPQPALGSPGNLGRNVFIGPGFANTDLNLTKRIPAPFLGNAGRMDFRAEFFNLFNRVNLQNPTGDLSSSTFGRSTAAFGARNIQFGLRISF
ncbi:MAG: TonB-dependent receptor domain-containing protein [Vicinamibacteraceae bacterium]